MKLGKRERIGRGIGALFVAAAALVLSGALVVSASATVKRGGGDADFLVGTPGADVLRGAGGDDTLAGKGGADKLAGGPGADKLKGGSGPDRMLAGGDSDRLLARDGAVDRVDCGGGLGDLAVVDELDRVSASCEQVEREPGEEPLSPVVGPMLPTPALTLPTPVPRPSDPAPPEEAPPTDLEEQPLALFPDGHGWTGNGVGTFTDVGAPFIVNDDRSYGITTNGAGDESIATSPPLDPVDLTGSHVSFQAQVSFSARLDAVKLRLASGNIDSDYAEATVWETDRDPIILGSSFEFQTLPRGAFDVTGDVDWSAIDRARIVLTDNEAGPVALYVAGIYAVPTSRQATISFVFDDGYETTFTRGMRKLSAYRYPATAYVIANAIGDPDILSLEQLETLRDQHHWEIAGHALSVADHNLPNGLDDLKPAALKAEMDGLRDWLDENGFPRTTFAYPKGAAGAEVRRFVKRDYCAGRSTARGPETIPTRDDYTMRGWSVNGTVDGAGEVEAAIDEAAADGTWLMLSFHDIVGGEPDVATEFEDDEFDAVVDHVRALQKEGGVRVRTVADAVAPTC